jgi:seryl-tRNA synthetase
MSSKLASFPVRAWRQYVTPFQRHTWMKRSLTSASHLSLDANVVANHLDVVLQHLHARHANEKLIEDVSKIPVLREKRNSLIVAGDAARNTRKTLSKEIGKYMSKGDKEQAALLKGKVEEANEVASKADEELQGIENEIQLIMSLVPNLLDDR